jgi:hypothetical protein
MMIFFRILMLVGAFLSLFGGIASKNDREGHRLILMELASGGLFLLSMIIQ